MNAVLQEVERRLALVEEYYENYRSYLARGAYSKASEYLWGIANNLASLLSLLKGGRPITRHSDLRRFLDVLVRELAAREGSGEVVEAFRGGVLALEILHANFFHDFLEERQFEELRIKAERLLKILEEELYRLLQAQFGGGGTL